MDRHQHENTTARSQPLQRIVTKLPRALQRRNGGCISPPRLVRMPLWWQDNSASSRRTTVGGRLDAWKALRKAC